MKTLAVVLFTVEFDRSHIMDKHLSHEHILIKAEATTGSTDVDPDNNVVQKQIPMHIASHIALFG